MRVSLIVEQDRISIKARAESDGAIGDLRTDIFPGDQFLGIPYEELVQLGTGGHDLEPRERPSE